MKGIFGKSLCVLVALSCVASGRSFGGADELSRFKQEYFRASEKLKSDLLMLKGTCLLTRRNEKEAERTTNATFAVDHGYRKLQFEKKISSGKTQSIMDIVYVVSPDGAFCLSRKQGPESKDYFVESLGTTDEEASTYKTLLGRFLDAPFSISGKPIAEIMASDKFRLLSAEGVDFEQSRCIRIEFEFAGPTPKSGQPRTDKAIVVLDPNQGWAVRRSELRIDTPFHPIVICDIKYAGGTACPNFVAFTDIDKSYSTFQSREVAVRPTPKVEFTMEHYNLPNTNQRPAKLSNYGRPMTFFALGSAGLIGAYAMRRAASRRP